MVTRGEPRWATNCRFSEIAQGMMGTGELEVDPSLLVNL
jgi:hypothetical protein